MSTKHTPGPWSLRRTAVYDQVEADGRLIAFMGYTTPEHGANARLIAAAPDMLAALGQAREVLARLEGSVLGYGVGEALRQIDEVVKEATKP